MEPQQENIYVSRITTCHKIIEDISKKIAFISSNNNVKDVDTLPVSSSSLDLNLQGL